MTHQLVFIPNTKIVEIMIIFCSISRLISRYIFDLMKVAIEASISAVLAYFAAQTIRPSEQQQRSPLSQSSSTSSTPSSPNFFLPDTVTTPIRLIEYPHFRILYSTVSAIQHSTIKFPSQCTNSSPKKSQMEMPRGLNFSSQMTTSKKNTFKSTIPTLQKLNPM